MTLSIPQCHSCKHFYEGRRCDAFPDEIPDAIIFNEHSHLHPYPGDNGIRYEPSDKALRRIAAREAASAAHAAKWEEMADADESERTTAASRAARKANLSIMLPEDLVPEDREEQAVFQAADEAYAAKLEELKRLGETNEAERERIAKQAAEAVYEVYLAKKQAEKEAKRPLRYS